ncbi:MAG: SGNH/GDSL hydrolase family protein [Alphaproteobacteria bacterium]|jgi:hypothetical protein|nr:SGNH/GDSL hydrolase family protein [Alphaproteobacteria bacterium]
MLMRAFLLLLACCGIAVANPCIVPAEMLDGTSLPRSRAAIEARELRVLVGGSASAEPAALGTAPYHARIAAALGERYPGLVVRVESRGRRGASAAEVLALIEREMPALRPHLVIWQTGTVEAARNLDPGEFTDKLSEGIARLRAHADVMLMDPQFSRFMRANADIDRYRDAIRLAAAAEGIALLRRWDWMRQWADYDGLDLERAPREERVAQLARLQECVARGIAGQIVLGTRR